MYGRAKLRRTRIDDQRSNRISDCGGLILLCRELFQLDAEAVMYHGMSVEIAMNKTIISVAAAAVIIGSIIPPADASGFIEESKSSLDMRNFNFRRDFPDTDNANQNEWAQSFILRMESGFTEGPVGFGVDVLGMVVLNLDSNATAARNGHAVRPSTGLSLVDKETGEAEDEYSKLGLTAKARVSKSVLKMGTLLPRYPVLGYSDSRMVPQTFRGSALTFQEVDHLTVDALRITQVKNRNSSDLKTCNSQAVPVAE